ncbi:MAG: enoyl-CoA hydratase-related protein [Acidimicrobiales bacterium]|jgi:2-(1,2-epoxy-1,2-dihydrophenyl)acetyl-CoA isomerase|nr:enoyl-CoA hydratase-related protein [Acidimicrobiales bacterium]MDP7124936.1 enoyl-CoA hydratase-related protein [Acidimicrobiales bacterium]MDP7507511.1 enoyl-CoA hydratase-related protein [Acidimicrobiales bacterium]MDP7542342.1 enoyl-CoA hydratase-related protein [Acidimicrobiales bacterium]MEE1563742.1 enoyl-CoA hydratase-related protein [Acidimicrobiales bacterium]|tara:strand:+ start:12347 stop:13126 length:780 start_codon:yes stop_codon:yes gene_type:complete
MSDDILVDTADGVGTVTLNRPDRLNTLANPTVDLLVEALDEVAADDSVRVVVLAGNGPYFCAGADQAEMVERAPQEWEPIVRRYLDPVRVIVGMDKPVVAALHGDTVGGGLGLALASDFRIAARGIRLGAPFTPIGLAGCDMSAGWFLPRLVGLGTATDLMFTGRLVDADEALDIGLVHRVADSDDFADAVAGLASQLAAGPPIALAWTKRAIHRSLGVDMGAEFEFEIFAQVQCIQTEDHREGVRAFKEKRRPEFRGA